MIRRARDSDIPAIVGMTRKLAAATRQPVEIDDEWTAAFLKRLLRRAGSFAEVVEVNGRVSGMLIASAEHLSVSPVRVAVEHGWWCEERGQGVRLLKSYLAWARDAGCGAVRLSSPPDDERIAALLKKHGFRPAEQAWVKGF